MLASWQKEGREGDVLGVDSCGWFGLEGPEGTAAAPQV